MTQYTPLEIMLKARTFTLMDDSTGADHLIIEQMLEDGEYDGVTQVCFKCSIGLRDCVNDAAATLQISKRRFYEAAVLHALEVYQRQLEDSGLLDVLTQRSEGGGNHGAR